MRQSFHEPDSSNTFMALPYQNFHILVISLLGYFVCFVRLNQIVPEYLILYRWMLLSSDRESILLRDRGNPAHHDLSCVRCFH